jgi:hypothetical protein
MIMKNIIHEIIYDEQNYTSSNTKTQKFIIPLLNDTWNKNNKNVMIITNNMANPLNFKER